ncbi:MAG: AhpC/TSA family protein [Odoribacteraceae bacterium]|jgi:thiol-disulfide isomerase/thioredoxin|nr:AhpC/TSA family protein [Odoribacteraceae bacterium]
MKHATIVVALSALIVTGCRGNKETVITGSITGNPGLKTLVYTVPLSGTSYPGFQDTIRLDEAGHFELKLAMKQPAFIRVWIPEPHVSAKIVAEPGNSYHVTMDANEKCTRVSGANEKGQMLYTSLPDPEYVGMEARKLNLRADTSLASIHEKVEALKQSELSKFKELLDNGEVSKSFFDLVKIDRDCYHASLEANVSTSKAFSMLESKQFVLPSGENVLENLARIFALYPPDDEQLLFSSFWNQYAENYVTNYKLFTREDFDLLKLREMYANRVLYAFCINESKNCLTGKALECFQAAYLHVTALQKKYEKELIALFEQFEKDYPSSEYTRYVKPLIDQIVLFHQINEKPFDETVQFVDDYEHVNTLEEAIKPLQGKKIYIDVWATWCGPCKEEFQHQQALKKILDEQNIQQLYISIDTDDHDQQWKDNIKFYGLSGTHIRANENLHVVDLCKRFDKNAKEPYIAIPWYILVDEKGNIIKEHAEWPSQIIQDPGILNITKD